MLRCSRSLTRLTALGLVLALAACRSPSERPGGSGGTAVAPTVVSLSPGEGAGSVPITGLVEAGFSSQMDPTSISTGTFKVMLKGQAVSGTVTLSADGKTATFKPAAALEAESTYSVKLTGMKDANGNLMADKSSTFQTSE